MNTFVSFLKSPIKYKLLSIEALYLGLFIRLALSLLPFRIWKPILLSAVHTSSNQMVHDLYLSGRIAHVVQKTSRYVPHSTCLVQALTVQIMLAKRDIRTKVCIGVAKDNENRLLAHAWLEQDEIIIIGKVDNLTHYTRLAELE
jgi:DNA mismatch repair protein MutH